MTYNGDTLTTGNIAKILHVAPTTVTKWIDSGVLKGHRVPCSRHRRIRREDFVDFMKQQSIPIILLEQWEKGAAR